MNVITVLLSIYKQIHFQVVHMNEKGLMSENPGLEYYANMLIVHLN